MRALPFLILITGLACSLIAPIVSARDISGTYVGTAPNAAYLLQIVKKADGSIAGRYEETTLRNSSSLTTVGAAVVGASNGSTVVATIKSDDLLTPDAQMSGVIDGSNLLLRGMVSKSVFELHLVLANETDYRHAVAVLDEQASAARERQAASDTLNRIQNLTEKMTAFTKHADSQLQKFPVVANSYRLITSKMQAALAKELSITGQAKADGYRNEASVWINQAALKTIALHNDANSAYADFNGSAQGLRNALGELQQSCMTHSVSFQTKGDADQELASACTGMAKGAKIFVAKEQRVRKAFIDLDAVWQHESAIQNNIVRQSDAAAN